MDIQDDASFLMHGNTWWGDALGIAECRDEGARLLLLRPIQGCTCPVNVPEQLCAQDTAVRAFRRECNLRILTFIDPSTEARAGQIQD